MLFIKLWNKDFIFITIGTFISVTGCTAMNLALSLVVYDQTSSTWLSGIYMAISLIPNLLLPFFIAPLIDRSQPQKIIVYIDYFTGILYLCFLLFIKEYGFQYYAYLLLSFVISMNDAIYDLAYQSLYPELIPDQLKQKGYAVSAMVEPLAVAFVAPLIAYIYSFIGIEIVFLIEGLLLIIAASFERNISYQKEIQLKQKMSIKCYYKELMNGIYYLKKEKGVLNIYSFQSLYLSTMKGRNMMTLAFFQSSLFLTTTMYSLLLSAETIGKMIGGLTSYFVSIPRNKKYNLSIKMYTSLTILEGGLLFVAYPLMLALKFISGFLGVHVSTMKEAAIQNYFNEDIRARVYSLYNMMMSICMIVVQLIVGALGEIISYRYVALVMSVFTMICMFGLIINKKDVEKIYVYDERK